MNRIRFYHLLLLCCTVVLAGCNDDGTTDPSNTGTLTMNITGLEDVGSNHRYEGWVIVNGTPKSTGTFSVNSAGVPSRSTFQVNSTDLDNASAFVLTVEPFPDSDPAPSQNKMLGGDFTVSSALVTTAHPSALNNGFSVASGSYILATPTNGMASNELSGVWFLDPSSGTPMASISLPTLPTGWEYEGWAVINDIPVSTGKFTAVNMADRAAPYSGSQPGPPFPGEDFLMNAPSGLTFPTVLHNARIVITVEPVPDNSPDPFGLKPLDATVAADAAPGTVYPLTNRSSTLPSGTVTR